MTPAAVPKTPESVQHSGALKLHRDHGFGEVSIQPLNVQLFENKQFSGNVMDHAINYLTSSVAALSAKTNRRGGARNRAHRESHELTTDQIANLIAAVRHAYKIGLPFTRMFTIHWEAAGVPLANMARATGRFVDLMTKAIARHDCGTAWVWIHENVPGKGYEKGGHCHLLAYIPANLAPMIAARQRGWLKRITGQPYRARVIHSRPIGWRLGLEVSNPDLHAVNLEAAHSYILKGASDEATAHFALLRQKPSGRVIGRRCSTSQNISAKARKAGK